MTNKIDIQSKQLTMLRQRFISINFDIWELRFAQEIADERRQNQAIVKASVSVSDKETHFMSCSIDVVSQPKSSNASINVSASYLALINFAEPTELFQGSEKFYETFVSTVWDRFQDLFVLLAMQARVSVSALSMRPTIEIKFK